MSPPGRPKGEYRRAQHEGTPFSFFSHIEPYAGDPILSLNDAFQKDPRKDKINLSIGIYFDDAGRIPVLGCVHQAEAQMLAEGGAKPYLPIEGSGAMRSAVQRLLFGAGHEAVSSGRIATLQTVGSSGGLRVGADFIKRWLPLEPTVCKVAMRPLLTASCAAPKSSCCTALRMAAAPSIGR